MERRGSRGAGQCRTSIDDHGHHVGGAPQANAVAEELERYMPDPGAVPRARFSDAHVDSEQASTMVGAMPFDMILGTCNPVAPPLTITFDPPKAIGNVTFSPQYEGAPGCVHGAALAGVFDIMLTAANFLVNAAGPTVELTIRYRKPTLISEPAFFEAWVTRQQGRRTYSQGQLIQDGVVKVEAVGEFVDIGRVDASARKPPTGTRPSRRRDIGRRSPAVSDERCRECQIGSSSSVEQLQRVVAIVHK